MVSLLQYLPMWRLTQRHETPEGQKGSTTPEDDQSDVKGSKSTVDSEFVQPNKVIATVDPDLNPGELSFEEGASGIFASWPL